MAKARTIELSIPPFSGSASPGRMNQGEHHQDRERVPHSSSASLAQDPRSDLSATRRADQNTWPTLQRQPASSLSGLPAIPSKSIHQGEEGGKNTSGGDRRQTVVEPTSPCYPVPVESGTLVSALREGFPAGQGQAQHCMVLVSQSPQSTPSAPP